MAPSVWLIFAIGTLITTPVAMSRPPTLPQTSEWMVRALNAGALQNDVERRDALLALLKETLGQQEVRLSGTKYPHQVHYADNAPWPVINFDLNLNRKRAFYPEPKAPTLSTANGYFFVVDGVAYVVIGPVAIDPRGPVITRMTVAHESFHATRHVHSSSSLEDRELEAWTSGFVGFFHDVYSFRLHWEPMLTYYETATAKAQAAAVQSLSDYYRNPPGSFSRDALRREFMDWLGRFKADPKTRSLRLIRDMEIALGTR